MTEAERAFRIEKHELGIRPIWHQKKDRVLGHILVCFLGYVLWKALAQWMCRAGLGDAPRTLLEEFAKIKSGNVVLPPQMADGIRLGKRPDFAPKRYPARIDRLNQRLGVMAMEEHGDADTRRLTKRLRRYGESIFTFLDYLYVPHDNNFGERQIRPAVILRKNSHRIVVTAAPPPSPF